jgi:hypothetical protein
MTVAGLNALATGEPTAPADGSVWGVEPSPRLSPTRLPNGHSRYDLRRITRPSLEVPAGALPGADRSLRPSTHGCRTTRPLRQLCSCAVLIRCPWQDAWRRQQDRQLRSHPPRDLQNAVPLLA